MHEFHAGRCSRTGNDATEMMLAEIDRVLEICRQREICGGQENVNGIESCS